jgi:AcrR family transcriptional regulator
MPGEAQKRRGRPPSGGREAILAAALELLRERGIARLTTREIATVAGVSEASIFYHYGDRAGLLMAVFEQGVKPLQALGERGLSGPDVSEQLGRLGPAVETFLDQALPVMTAAQSDVELRDALAGYMAEQGLGPHRGVSGLGAYLTQQQADGRVRDDVDPEAVALMFVGACFIRASQRQMPVPKVELPGLEGVISALDTMLAPPRRRGANARAR